MLTLVEELQSFFIAQPSGYTEPAKFYMTINKTARNQWSAGYQDYETLRILLAVNNCDSLEEVAIRLAARLDRYVRLNTPKPRRLYEFSKDAIVGNSNLTKGVPMPDETNTESKPGEDAQSLTFGEKAVGLSFNPSGSTVVNNIKKQCAAIIDGLNAERNSTTDPEVKRMYSVAITEVQTAQMWAVKAVTWR